MAPETTRSRLAQKLREADTLRERLLQSRLEAQQLRIRLLSVGVADTRVVPGQISAGSGGSASLANTEIRSLLEWLAEAVDLTQQAQFECGGGAPIAVGGRRVVLRAMCAMPLRGGAGAQSKMQLSVPQDLRLELANILANVRRRGGKAGDADVARVADSWEIVGAEMVSATTGRPEPAIFLVRRPAAGESDAAPVPAMIVAQWPSVDFAALAAANAFDAGRHFQGLAATSPDLAAQACAQPASELAASAAQPQDERRAESQRQAPLPQQEEIVRVSAAAPKAATMAEVHMCDRPCQRLDAEGHSAGVVCGAAEPETASFASPEASQKTTKVWGASPRHVLRHTRSRTVG